jgi:hypothetical protein
LEVTEVKEFCPFDYSSRKAAEPQRIIILKIKNLGAFAFLRLCVRLKAAVQIVLFRNEF